MCTYVENGVLLRPHPPPEREPAAAVTRQAARSGYDAHVTANVGIEVAECLFD